MARNDLIQFRRGTAAQWATVNPVLAEGEVGFETDTGKLKVGDGAAAWTALTYINGDEVDASTWDAIGSKPDSVTALAGLTSAPNKGIQFTGAGTAATFDLTAAGKALLDDPDAAAQRTTLGALGLVQAAKNPDLLVTGAITVDGNDLITSAAVVWPDGTPGTLTITSRDANSAVLGYNITYGSPVSKTYTQPTITRNTNGAATNVPAIAVS